MPGSWPPHELPNLTDDNCEVTSPVTNRYNCLAWAAGEDHRNWWPDPLRTRYWPPGVPREITVNAFVLAYGTLGYHLCLDPSLEAGIEKIALYGKGPAGGETPTHAALQTEDGIWTSKLGAFEDIGHADPEDVEGPAYGRVICYFSRPRPLAPLF